MNIILSFFPGCEGIDWESDELEEAATKIQVETNYKPLSDSRVSNQITNPLSTLEFQRPGFLGGKLDVLWQNSRRKMRMGRKKTKRIT